MSIPSFLSSSPSISSKVHFGKQSLSCTESQYLANIHHQPSEGEGRANETYLKLNHCCKHLNLLLIATERWNSTFCKLHTAACTEITDETEKSCVSLCWLLKNWLLGLRRVLGAEKWANYLAAWGVVGWVGIHQHHRRPAKSQGLWPREVAAAPAGPHQARDYTTSSSRSSSSRN